MKTMWDLEHEKRVWQGVEAWNAGREEQQEIQPDLSEATLMEKKI